MPVLPAPSSLLVTLSQGDPEPGEHPLLPSCQPVSSQLWDSLSPGSNKPQPFHPGVCVCGGAPALSLLICWKHQPWEAFLGTEDAGPGVPRRSSLSVPCLLGKVSHGAD